jgi:hypothetical protein
MSVVEPQKRVSRVSDFRDAGLDALIPFTRVGTARPETWGPPLWDALVHMLNAVGNPTQESFEDDPSRVIFTLSDEDLKVLVERLDSFSYLIPCPKCASHFRQALSKIDMSSPSMHTRAGWLDWVTRQKDAVNRLAGKRTHTEQERAAFVRDILNMRPAELVDARKREIQAPPRLGELSSKKKAPSGGAGGGRGPGSALQYIFYILILLALAVACVFLYTRPRSAAPKRRERSTSER